MWKYLFLFITWASVAPALTNNLPYNRPSEAMIASLQTDALRLLQSPPRTLDNETDLACIAVTVFHEARGESIEGQKAVASVVIQRSLVPDRWGDTPCAVVQPVQFSYLTPTRRYAAINTNTEGAAWERAVRVALTVMITGPEPQLAGADHYHTHAVFPTWRHSMHTARVIGNHIFYVDPDSLGRNNAYDRPAIAWTQVPYTAPQAPISGQQVATQEVAVYDWSGAGVPTQTVTRVSTQSRPQTAQAAGGFLPVRGPDVAAIRTAQQAQPAPFQVAQNTPQTPAVTRAATGMFMGLPTTDARANNGYRLGLNPVAPNANLSQN